MHLIRGGERCDEIYPTAIAAIVYGAEHCRRTLGLCYNLSLGPKNLIAYILNIQRLTVIVCVLFVFSPKANK